MLVAALLCSHLLAAAPATAAPVAPSALAAEPRGVSLADREPVREKSVNLLLAGFELTASLVLGYVGVLGGVAINFGKGGMSWPPDGNDLALLGLLPAALAAGGGWVVGLMDLGQRTLLGSLLSAALGAVVGELVGLGAGYLVGRSVTPNDFAGAASLAVLIAPAFSALGSVVFMEWLKPGHVAARASLAPVRGPRGQLSLVPAVAVRW